MSNVRNLDVLLSAAQIATFQSAVFKAESARHIAAVIDITVVTGSSPTLDIDFQMQDHASGKWVTILSTTQKTGTGTTRIQIGHGLPVTANISANDVLPQSFRFNFTIAGTTPSFTFSVGATLS